jgi:hypothetical protein
MIGNERDRRARERAMRRRAGMSQEAKDALKAHLRAQRDWWAVCPKCGAAITDKSLAELGEHTCDATSDST